MHDTTTFRPYEPDQAYLLPRALQDWLPSDHLVLFVMDLGRELDLSEIYASYDGRYTLALNSLPANRTTRIQQTRIARTIKLRKRTPATPTVAEASRLHREDVVSATGFFAPKTGQLGALLVLWIILSSALTLDQIGGWDALEKRSGQRTVIPAVPLPKVEENMVYLYRKETA